MTGVNELADHFRKLADDGVVDQSADLCADEVDEVARTAWHTVSEPPTEADGDEAGRVLFKRRHDIPMQMENVATVAHASESLRLEQEGRLPKQMGLPRKGQWARVSDVVLMPPQGGE